MAESDAQPNRLCEIAEQVRDGWVRGRGPLTGVKPLVAARQEAVDLGADEVYLSTFDEIIASAKSIAGGSAASYRRDAPQVLEAAIARLREHCAAETA